jgi:hypothetical protein
VRNIPDNTIWHTNPILTIEGDSFEHCKEKLRWQYEGRSEYQLVSRREIPVRGIRGFFTRKTKTEVEYMLVSKGASPHARNN